MDPKTRGWNRITNLYQTQHRREEPLYYLRLPLPILPLPPTTSPIIIIKGEEIETQPFIHIPKCYEVGPGSGIIASLRFSLIFGISNVSRFMKLCSNLGSHVATGLEVFRLWSLKTNDSSKHKNSHTPDSSVGTLWQVTKVHRIESSILRAHDSRRCF